ncbi:MAG TPA: glycosyltransferase family 39 protein [Pyrinomonadaceae bacterium]|nr:glycosyltransferase family 39 protein [Pyrinomonadaceae bacterium]
MNKKHKSARRNKTDGKRNGILIYVLLLIVAFSFRFAVARFMPNDSPDDGRVYAQIARNLLEQHVYSHETEAPFAPSLIRLPGYPLLLAGVYSVFGHNDNAAVRAVQAVIDTATCGLIALVAFQWEPDKKRKRASSITALALAAVCPFTTIYVATILTETPTMFFAVACVLTATLALKARNQKMTLWLWLATGLLAGMAVLFRPDSGLIALAIGIALVVATLGRAGDLKLSTKREELLYRTARTSYLGAVFTLAFCAVLLPWAVRNYRVFNIFEPLAPAHAEMPGEFVPRGYLTWVRTWLDDSRYIGPVLWSLDSAPIKLADIPDRAFDSADEKSKVGELLEQYNHTHEEPALFTDQPEVLSREAQPKPTEENETDNNEPGKARTGESDQADDGTENDESDNEESDEGGDENVTADQASDQAVEMTPEIDLGFAQLAAERIARHPLRYYLLLPLKRAHSLWFNTHSDFYPFEGQLLPLDELDYDVQQQYWLPLFAFLALAYSLLGIAGGWLLWQTGAFDARLWVLLAALIIFVRLGFFATLENPEPRYVVEIFPFLSILGGIAAIRIPVLLASSRKAGPRKRAG